MFPILAHIPDKNPIHDPIPSGGLYANRTTRERNLFVPGVAHGRPDARLPKSMSVMVDCKPLFDKVAQCSIGCRVALNCMRVGRAAQRNRE